MTENERKELVKLQLERAWKFLNQANEMLGSKHYDLAANRYYYACYHAVQGLFINDGITRHTHKGLHTTLGQNYVLTGKFDPVLSSIFRTMEQLREKADYNCAYTISEKEVLEMKGPSIEIINEVNSLIESSNG